MADENGSEIVVEADGSLAVLHIPAHREEPLDELKDRVTAAGVRFGLQPDALLAATRPAAEERNLVLARWREALAGLAWQLVDDLTGEDEGEEVRAGQLLAEVERTDEPRPGMAVDGAVLEPPPHPDGMRPGPGIECRGEEGIYAAEDGWFRIDEDGTWRVEAAGEAGPGWCLQVAEDAMEAWLEIPAGEQVPAADLREALDAEGVTYGLRDDQLAAALQPAETERRPVIARGTPPEPGEDGSFTYAIDEHPVFAEREDGTYDFSESHLVHEVAENQLLGTHRPAVPGRPGMTVRGEDVAPPEVDDVDLGRILGENVELREDRVVAVRGGIYGRRPDGMLEVKEQLVVDGDLDMHTGNVDTAFAVHVRGDIKAGFKVKSGGNVVVDGSVEDSRVSARGNLEIKGGILPGRNRVKAHGDLICRYIRERPVKGKSVLVRTVIRHSSVYATGEVVADGILGGRVTAAGDVRVKELGDAGEQRTWVQAGVDPYLQARIDDAARDRSGLHREVNDLRRRAVASSEHADELARQVMRMKEDEVTGDALADAVAEARSALEFSQEVLRSYQAKMQALQSAKDILAQRKRQDAGESGQVVRVSGTVHPGCEIAIGPRLQRRVDAEERNVCFRIVDGQVTT